MTPMNGSQLICAALKAEGVDTLFGHPGGAILPFYDALHTTDGLRHILMRHEQAAAHAADGYARASGRVGVCVATSGPGATNLVTGLATAQMDSVPVVAITGQVASGALGTEAFQETDVVGVTMPVTKHGFLVRNVDDIPEIVAEAFALAKSGRPGPVLIDVPKDIQVALASRTHVFQGGRTRPGDIPPTCSGSLSAAADILNCAERPVLMVGRGVVLAGVCAEVQALAERADLPVVTTLLGLDAFPAEHDLALGMPGMHGTERANRGIQDADVILGLGLRFDDRVVGRVEDFGRGARIIHFEVNPAIPGRTVSPEVTVMGDLRTTVPAFAPLVESADRSDWHANLSGWSREADPHGAVISENPGPLGGRQAVRKVAERIARRGAIAATDVGQHQMWFAQELKGATPATHLTSGGLGTMGFALPAALGAAVALPHKTVWAVAGDGGFQMNLQELATLVQERIPLRIAVVNNGFLGMVRQWQEKFYERRYSASAISGPDFVALAAAYGIPAWSVSTREDVDAVLDDVERVDGPALVDLRVVSEENVYPMVPAGAALDELIMPQPSAVRAS